MDNKVHFILIVLIAFIIGACTRPDYAVVYFYQTEFHSTPAINCKSIEQSQGVKKLIIRDRSEMEVISSLVKTLEIYSDTISKYSIDIRDKILLPKDTICSNISFLINQEYFPDSIKSNVINKYFHLLKNNENKAIDINPLLDRKLDSLVKEY
jgi:hypothetical protein